MGGGKTASIAHWAALRGYRRAVVITPASVAPGIIEDLKKWGFPAARLTHGTVSRLLEQKRRHRLSRERVKTARLRVGPLRERLAEMLRLDQAQRRLGPTMRPFSRRDLTSA